MPKQGRRSSQLHSHGAFCAGLLFVFGFIWGSASARVIASPLVKGGEANPATAHLPLPSINPKATYWNQEIAHPFVILPAGAHVGPLHNPPVHPAPLPKPTPPSPPPVQANESSAVESFSLPTFSKADPREGAEAQGGKTLPQGKQGGVETLVGAARMGEGVLGDLPGSTGPPIALDLRQAQSLFFNGAASVLQLAGRAMAGRRADVGALSLGETLSRALPVEETLARAPPGGSAPGPADATRVGGGRGALVAGGMLVDATGLGDTGSNLDQSVNRLLADPGSGERRNIVIDDVCRFNQPGLDRCAYIGKTNVCHDEQKYLPYLPTYACAGRMGQIGLIVLYFVWLLVMFYSLSEVAEGFLVPAVEYIAERLKLPPAIAGVTLLSFAGGAPDLFTQLAAVSAGQGHVDLGLAISSTMGSGLFTTCILMASVILIRPLEVEDRGAFVCDAGAYVVACVAILCFLWNEKLGCAESAVLVSMYFLYVASAFYSSRGVQAVASSGGGGAGGPGLHWRESGLEQEDGGIELACLGPVGQPQPGGAASGGPLVLMAPTKAGGGAAQTQTLRKTVSLSAGGTSRSIAVGAGTRAVTSSHSTGASGAIGETSVFTGWEGGEENGLLSGDMRATISSDSERQGEAEPFCRRSAGRSAEHSASPRPASWRHALLEALDALVRPLKGKGWAGALWAAATAPLLLAFHSTNPSLHVETYSAGYGVLLAAVVPGFSLLATGFTPRVISPAGFATAWLAGSVVILAAMLHRLRKLNQAFAPRRSSLMAFMSLTMSAIWLMVIADEMVALLQAAGRIWNFPMDMIGGTILSWGETVPELAATYTLAKAGQGTMALAACFGCPVFNVLMGLGLPVLYQSWLSGSLDLQLTNGIFLLIIQSVIVLAVLLVVVPLVSRWKVGKRLGWGLVAMYVVFQLVFVLTEEEVLWTKPWDPHTAPAVAQ